MHELHTSYLAKPMESKLLVIGWATLNPDLSAWTNLKWRMLAADSHDVNCVDSDGDSDADVSGSLNMSGQVLQCLSGQD